VSEVQKVKIVSVEPCRAWIDNRTVQGWPVGGKVIRLQHASEPEPFDYIVINYDHRYTDNASVRMAAETILAALNGDHARRVGELDSALAQCRGLLADQLAATQSWRDKATAAEADAGRLRALLPPPGYVSVPAEATPYMVMMGEHWLDRLHAGIDAFEDAADNIWTAMAEAGKHEPIPSEPVNVTTEGGQ
jgi:hypothetical protein